MAFVDSQVWIGAKLGRDQWHSRSLGILTDFSEKKIRTAFLTDYIILEVINFLVKKKSYEAAAETLELFRNHERIKIINIDEILFERICAIFKENQHLSFGDCSIVAAMEDMEVKTLYSFDSGFDSIRWIERREA